MRFSPRLSPCVAALAVLITACKPDNSDNKSSLKEATISPKLVAGKGEAVPTENWGTIEIDDKGSLKGKLIMSLDFIPTGPATSAAVLPVCMKTLPADFRVGELVCIEGHDHKIAIQAGHLNQECYTDPGYPKTAAKMALALPGCKKARVLGWRFKPELRIDIDAK